LPSGAYAVILCLVHVAPTSRSSNLVDLTDRLDDALAEGRIEDARAHHRTMARLAGGRDPAVRLAELRIRWVEHGAQTIVAELTAMTAEHPRDADLYHLLGVAHEELGERQRMVDAFLKTLELDSADDDQSEPFAPALLDAIEARARAVLDALPAELARRLSKVPVLLESRPSADVVAEGFDPRALGLFEGAMLAEPDLAAPSRIVLYVHNLFEATEDDDALLEEVEVTVLHEVGHYFGLDEDEVAELGLA
jgi:predicted Zn-dependent protease with MMP-like domain